MFTIVLIAWRNIWRNKPRTLVVVAAISVGLSGALFAVAFSRGMIAQLAGEVIDMECPHLVVVPDRDAGTASLQVRELAAGDRNAGDRDANDIGFGGRAAGNRDTFNRDANGTDFGGQDAGIRDTICQDSGRIPHTGSPARSHRLIGDAVLLAGELTALEGVLHASPRLVLPAMMATAHAAAHVVINGIDPEAERGLTDLHRRIEPENGSYFAPEAVSPVVIGRRLAEDLNAGLNTRIVATFRDSRGEVVSTLFRVAGIFSYQNSSFERRKAYVLRDELAQWHDSSPGSASEIALRMEDGLEQAGKQQEQLQMWLEQKHDAETAQPVQQAFSAGADDTESSHHKRSPLTVQTWEMLRPEVAFFYHYAGFISTLILAIILLALSLVVMNTMLMVVNERRTELGVLRALGMKDRRLMAMMTFETLFMMLPGVAVSLVVTALLTVWFSSKGIDLGIFMEKYESPTHDYQSLVSVITTVYPVYSVTEVVRLSVLVLVTAFVSAWMPVRNALRIHPAEAVKEMLPG